MKFYFTEMTTNTKLGPMPVVTASRDTCPPSCLWYTEGCYALFGPLGIFWRNLEKNAKALDWKGLLRKIRGLKRGTIWRYGQAGDLPPTREMKMELAHANRGNPVICFSHDRDIDTLRQMTEHGFVVNLSADSLDEADELATTGLPVAVVLPSFYKRKKTETVAEYRKRLGGSLLVKTPSDRRVAICPQTYVDGITCVQCQLCTKARPNNTIIGFPAHGVQKRSIDMKLQSRGL